MENKKTNKNKFKNNINSGIILNDLNNENFKQEALSIYNAINEGKIELNPEEKKYVLKELDLILNHFEDSSNNGNSLDKKSIDDNPNNIFHGEKNSDNLFLNSQNNINLDDKYVDFSDDFSVDDALNDLIDDNDSIVMMENLDEVESIDDFVPMYGVEDKLSVDLVVDNDVGNHLSVDDALNDLIEDYSNEIAIKVENVSMQFKVSKDKIDTLKEYFIRTVKRNKSKSKIITAVDNVSFEIPKGDRVGIIGFNGAGKSTLLKILARVYDATEGTIEIKGKIAPLLELGAGFDSNYTGKDNIFLNGAFLGYPEDFLKEKYDEILEFSELGDAINYHVKTYSSGMRAKLAFSIATIVEPDILIIDEILSVGDIKFRKKSADKIRSLINSGITVLLVSHSISQIRDLCNKAIWIDEGKLKMYGEVNQVCDAYIKAASTATKDQLENIKLN